MARPHKLRDIEQVYAQPLTDLVLHLLNELGSIPAVARHLDTSTQTIYSWCVRNNIKKQISWIVGDQTGGEATHGA